MGADVVVLASSGFTVELDQSSSGCGTGIRGVERQQLIDAVRVQCP